MELHHHCINSDVIDHHRFPPASPKAGPQSTPIYELGWMRDRKIGLHTRKK
jgi:hypothetical protein